jgi:hypothetical protein
MSASSSYVFPSSQSSSSDTYDFTPSETSESSTFDPSSFQSYPSDRSASASASGSFFRPPSASEDDDIDSLPSSDISDFGSDISDLSQSDAQKEWEQSLQQLELLLTMVIVPYLGKYFGRKFAYWSE